jgi:hypothetical protein
MRNGAEEDLHVVGTKRWNCCCFLAQRYICICTRVFQYKGLTCIARVSYPFLTVCPIMQPVCMYCTYVCSVIVSQWGWCGTELMILREQLFHRALFPAFAGSSSPRRKACVAWLFCLSRYCSSVYESIV